MSTRHGIYRHIPPGLPKGTRLTADQFPVLRWGIWQVFDALRAGGFPSDSDRVSTASLEFHFREVCTRFVYSLEHLNELMQRMAECFDRKTFPLESMQISLDAGCHADHALTYLGTIVDDVAEMIVLATNVAQSNGPMSMGRLKGLDPAEHPALAPVHPLLSELDRPGTWWELAFKKRHGARQLLVHNQCLVTFQGAQSPGEAMEAQAHLVSPLCQRAVGGNFFKLLREILASLCDWLDRLEVALMSHLQTGNPTWKPRSECASIHLGLGIPASGVNHHPLYFPFPLCDGSDPLPWSIGSPVVGDGAVIVPMRTPLTNQVVDRGSERT